MAKKKGRGKDFQFLPSAEKTRIKEFKSFNLLAELAKCEKYRPWLKDTKAPYIGLRGGAPAEAIEAWQKWYKAQMRRGLSRTSYCNPHTFS